MDIKPGTLIANRYWILSHLGSGGMADVYHAQDKNLLRDTAIKLLHTELSNNTQFIERFHHEARAAANLSHPNLVTVFDFGLDSEIAYLVMEYIEGQDLKSYLRQNSPLPIPLAVHLMQQICSGAGYAHRAGLVHCDLKPQNILLTTDGRVKIADFGIARTLADINPEEHSEIIWGSPQYLAPEVAAGGAPSAASDVYSLGIMLYEMVTGSLPFIHTDAEELLEMHLTQPPPSPRQLNADIPATLEQIIFKVLAKEPSARYRTADQFGRVLEVYESKELELPQEGFSISALPNDESNEKTELFPSADIIRIDWLAITLSLLAFVAIGGLVPFWIWICLLYPTCPINAP
ncbi:MAG: serine/threonine protein kinase [Anaerolineales bacterium]|nr:serine/threonine protein kinase [Anaerolineales bacterium]